MATGTPLAFEPHDHKSCQRSGLAEAQRLCQERGARLTPAREAVLRILLEAHRPMGAYELLQRLSEEGHPSQPPLVYRALDFLIGLGLTHKIERLNAFIACCHPGDRHDAQFLICGSCKRVAELEDASVTKAVAKALSSQGFAQASTTLEVMGTCPACRAQAS